MMGSQCTSAFRNDIGMGDIILITGIYQSGNGVIHIFLNGIIDATLPEWDDDEEVTEEDHELVQELYGIWDTLNQNKMLEAWHDAQQIREEALDLFSHGIVDLKTRAQIERLYWSVMREVNQIP